MFLALFPACNRAPESVRVKEEVEGPSDLVKGTPPNPHWHAYQLQRFQLNHVWAGAGRRDDSGNLYRAKVTLWDYSDDDSPVAEVYFHESAQDISNPPPSEAKRPYQLHFPITAVGPILQTLRNANQPIYLYYFENQWAIGINAPESVGID
ncbi:MAG TPA: hypothetical protein VHD62_12720 [Opitutaceae bacterium]|nr:hypothetical protein [Opitutaceae bacterium]